MKAREDGGDNDDYCDDDPQDDDERSPNSRGHNVRFSTSSSTSTSTTPTINMRNFTGFIPRGANIALLPPRDPSQALLSNLPQKLHRSDKPPGTPDNREKPLTRKPLDDWWI